MSCGLVYHLSPLSFSLTPSVGKLIFERVEVVETSSPDWKSGVIAVIRHPQSVTTFGVGYHFYVNEEANPTNITGVGFSH